MKKVVTIKIILKTPKIFARWNLLSDFMVRIHTAYAHASEKRKEKKNLLFRSISCASPQPPYWNSPAWKFRCWGNISWCRRQRRWTHIGHQADRWPHTPGHSGPPMSGTCGPKKSLALGSGQLWPADFLQRRKSLDLPELRLYRKPLAAQRRRRGILRCSRTFSMCVWFVCFPPVTRFLVDSWYRTLSEQQMSLPGRNRVYQSQGPIPRSRYFTLSWQRTGKQAGIRKVEALPVIKACNRDAMRNKWHDSFHEYCNLLQKVTESRIPGSHQSI